MNPLELGVRKYYNWQLKPKKKWKTIKVWPYAQHVRQQCSHFLDLSACPIMIILLAIRRVYICHKEEKEQLSAQHVVSGSHGVTAPEGISCFVTRVDTTRLATHHEYKCNWKLFFFFYFSQNIVLRFFSVLWVVFSFMRFCVKRRRRRSYNHRIPVCIVLITTLVFVVEF